MQKLDLSIIIPAFNEVQSIPQLYNLITDKLSKKPLSYEVIFIDDGSNDDTWKEMQKITISDKKVKAIKFSKNYGKSDALDAGFKESKGDYILTMDADLQDDPSEIYELFQLIKNEKFDLVSGWKKKRNDPITKTIPSKFFNYVTRVFSGIKLNDFNCGIKIYRKEVIKSINLYGEMHRYIPLIAKWNGSISHPFRTEYL